MKVAGIMKRDVFVVGRDTSVPKAMKLMVEKDIGSLLVQDGQIFGIVTRKDVVNKLIACSKDLVGAQISEILTEPILTISPDMEVREVARLMAKANVRRFPVVEDGKLVGIVSNSDVFRSFL